MTDPTGYKLLRDTTHAERSWPESGGDHKYSNTCCECGRSFEGFKRRVVCRACASAPDQSDIVASALGTLTVTDRKREKNVHFEWGDGAFALPAGKYLVYPGSPSWRPIETAPRDGSNILLRFGIDGVSQGKFIPGRRPHPWQFIDTQDGMDWLLNYSVDGPGGPSHWMPMPPAENGASQ